MNNKSPDKTKNGRLLVHRLEWRDRIVTGGENGRLETQIIVGGCRKTSAITPRLMTTSISNGNTQWTRLVGKTMQKRSMFHHWKSLPTYIIYWCYLYLYISYVIGVVYEGGGRWICMFCTDIMKFFML